MKNGDRINHPILPEELQQRRKQFGYSYAYLAELSGIPLGTVQKVLGGFTKTPRSTTLAALDRVLFPEKYTAEERQYEAVSGHTGHMEVHDGMTVYDLQPSDILRKKACQLIDQLSGDSVEALIQIMVRMLPGNKEEAAGRETGNTPKMQAFLDMQKMRAVSASYDISEAQRETAIDRKYGTGITESISGERHEGTD